MPMVFSRSKNAATVQLELPIEHPRLPDRNFAKGGRSFYFFDFDDNVLSLPTPLFLFHKHTGEEKSFSTREFAQIGEQIGKEGLWRDYEIRLCDQTGSFRRFRHRQLNLIQRLFRRRQPLIEDLLKVLPQNQYDWRGPSWNFFWHAVHNERPLSIITARGHRPETLQEAISVLKKHGHLSRDPNYLSVFPVSHRDIRAQLGDREFKWHASKLKQEAIKFSVQEAFKIYGFNPNHRFGMSDDDPVNIRLIIEAMQDLKRQYPDNSFYVIDTHGGRLLKQEILMDSVQNLDPLDDQLGFFSN
jgi:hypothetical protein